MKFTQQLSAQQFTQAFEFLSERSYWSKGISRERLEKAFAHSLCFALIENNQLLAFARVVTDRATFANLLDVFVLEQFRGQGLGKMLIDHVISHPELQSLRRFTLATRDAHSLYQQFGFQSQANPNLAMEKCLVGGYSTVLKRQN